MPRARINPLRANWCGEVARLAGVLRDAEMVELAARAESELAWASDEPGMSEPTHDLTAVWQRIEKTCLDRGHQRIGLYGSGRHSAKLLAVGWPSDPGLELVALIDDAPGKSGFTIAGVPIIPPEQAVEYHLDVILPSSDANEGEIYPRCQALAAEIGADTMSVYLASVR